ncbi:MAG: hypothetical protein JST43_05975 [Bacteroidetes bacterium]|nr:hypothetical protein [Bacteroidota bacterium]MBS1539341.1 hypothetical protein [Bacteroidota bacterium]
MKRFFFFLAIVLCSAAVCAQDMGVSVSYFLPRNGYFSTPISPFSIRGIGINFTDFFGIQTGASIYRMSGLNMINLPFDSKEPLIGPNFTFYVPAELVFQLKGKNVQFDIKGGGFMFYGVDQKINYGNMDRALRSYQHWDVANSSLSFQNNVGLGTHFGAEFTVYVTNQVGISLEGNYLMGSSKMPLKGNVVGGSMSGSLQTAAIDYSDAKIDFTGYEISMGLIFKNGGGQKKAPSRRRR